jgi:hypothetical protein
MNPWQLLLQIAQEGCVTDGALVFTDRRRQPDELRKMTQRIAERGLNNSTVFVRSRAPLNRSRGAELFRLHPKQLQVFEILRITSLA